MRKRLISLIIIDIILIAAWLIVVNAIEFPAMAAIGILLLLPTLILISGLIGLILYWRKSIWGHPLLINVVIALVLYFGVWKYKSWKQEQENHRKYYSADTGKTYRLIIQLDKGEFQSEAI